jgi:antitoxin MazE
MMSTVSTCRNIALDLRRGEAAVRNAHKADGPSMRVYSWGVTMAVQTLKRWGNSLAVRIPANIAQEARLAEGQAIDVQVVDGKVQLLPYMAIKRFSRDRYLQQLRERKLESHDAVDFGAPQGSEFGGPEDPR